MLKVVRSSDITPQLWEGFTLVRNANSGDPAALHELGLRYLTGQGFTADTVKSFELIRRAAEKNYLLAHYNMAVFYHNGWGVEWNPFNGFKHFQYAAEQGLREGAFAYSLQFTDNLVVQRDWKKALYWMQKAVELGYAPAKEVLPEIERFAAQQQTDSAITLTTISAQSAQTPILMDFANTEEENSENSFSLIDILRALGPLWQKKIKSYDFVNDSILFAELVRHAEWGVPEEFAVLGRCYENGIAVPRDSIKAILNYVRAVRLESRRAPGVLIRLLNSEAPLKKIQQRANRGDMESQYMIAAFSLTEIFPNQQKEDIITTLLKSAQQHYLPAMIELGTAYFNGQIVPQQRERAMEFWSNALKLGSNEASVRMASVKILTGYGVMSNDSALKILTKGYEESSLLAEVTLAYCYERGIVVSKKTVEAVRLYRSAANRGSRIAFTSLRRLYDSVRPEEEEFLIKVE
ncbi:MAG: tetratricopeptide repeat protein [Bacteroidota bacterium]